MTDHIVESALDQDLRSTEFFVVDTNSGIRIALNGDGAVSPALDGGAYYLGGTVGCFIDVGEDPTATDAGSSLFVGGAFSLLPIAVPAGAKIAAKRYGSVDGYLYVTPVRRDA